MRLTILSSMVLLAALSASGCGSEAPAPSRSSGTVTTPQPAPSTTTPPRRLDRAAQCHAPRTSAGPLQRAADLPAAELVIVRAAKRATRSGHRFTIELRVAAGRLRGTATIFGRRTAQDTSAALVVWSGLAGAVLPDLGLRIVDDRLYLQPGTFTSPWRVGGSASGVSLDVGRELLDHPFLLEPTTARGDGDVATTVSFSAPPERLRAYATSERRGRVTDLLRAARRLTLTADVRGGTLVGDRFTLLTTVPESLHLGPAAPGTRIRIDGVTTYCALRSVDRTPITAPNVSGD
ncbi:MAG: hypothetical protein JWL76_1652 [Thermoleophilia bacterium]|nr:hypothetical protein [Thermoleophilia bacterium]